MKVWLTQISEPLPIRPGVRKLRTAMLADKLVERGHEVLWWTSAFDHFNKRMLFERDTELGPKPGLRIRALRGMPYRRNVSLERYMDHRLIACKFVANATREPTPDIVVASMPDHWTAYEAVRYAKSRKVPVVVDIRDRWPDMFVDMVPRALAPLVKFVLLDDFRRLRIALRGADATTSMMEDLLAWGLNRACRARGPRDRVFYLGAEPLPLSSESELSEEVRSLLRRLERKFIVTYVGTFGVYNSPDVVVDAARQLNDGARGDRFAFVLAGHGPLLDRVRRRAAGMANIYLTGWLRPAEISAVLARSSAGVVPMNITEGAFPNKVFLYTSGSVPIVTSAQGELREMIRNLAFGEYFPPNDAAALSAVLRRWEEQPRLVHDLQENARRVHVERFDADAIYSQFADYLERVAFHRPEGMN